MNYSKEVHNIRKQYQGKNQKLIRDRIDTLITKVVSETHRWQNVEVSVYIESKVHVIGEGRPNKLSMVLREELKHNNDDGIDVEWTFITEGTYLKECGKEVAKEIKKGVKGLWKGIVQILQGVKQDAIEGGRQMAIKY